MGHCQSQAWDPNFTSSESMTELSPLFRAKLHLSDLTRGGMAALCLCVRMKGIVPQFDFYRMNPHQAGKGLLHSKFLDLIHLLQACFKATGMKLQYMNCFITWKPKLLIHLLKLVFKRFNSVLCTFRIVKIKCIVKIRNISVTNISVQVSLESRCDRHKIYKNTGIHLTKQLKLGVVWNSVGWKSSWNKTVSQGF